MPVNQGKAMGSTRNIRQLGLGEGRDLVGRVGEGAVECRMSNVAG
jgi:hypothetical protein